MAGISELRSQQVKITDKIAALPPGSPYYSFEVKHDLLAPHRFRPLTAHGCLDQVFPPKTEIGTANLVDRIERMTALAPTWLHVTWGAGGSTQERSLELAGAAQALGVDTCLHLTCTNMEQRVLDQALKVRGLLELCVEC